MEESCDFKETLRTDDLQFETSFLLLVYFEKTFENLIPLE
jgi:hypothetical protein